MVTTWEFNLVNLSLYLMLMYQVMFMLKKVELQLSVQYESADEVIKVQRHQVIM